MLRIAWMATFLLPAASTAGGTLSFTDVWTTHGLPGTNGGHGAMFADADGDGDPDLYLPLNFTPQIRADLFIRNDGGTFVSAGAAHGIDDAEEGSHGAAWADLDNDGDYDLVNGTTYGASNWNDVFRNDGAGLFDDVTPASMQARLEPTRALIAVDLDADGDLDLYGVTNSKGSNDPPAERNEVWRNDGGFQFAAVDSGDLWSAPAGQGATDTDYDGDGDVDVIAANRNGDVHMLRNDGGGIFRKIAPSTYGITDRAKDGITSADVDNDGDLDLLLTGDDEGFLYRNDGATFSPLATFSGTDGYMGGFADLDNDGDLDLVFAGDDVVWLGDGTGAFTTGPSLTVTGLNDPRGIAFADLEGDGDMDFALGIKNARNALFVNGFDSGNWLRVGLVSPDGQAGAFGTKVRVHPAGQAGGTLLGLREARSNQGYLGQDDPVLHFGLGAHASVDVVVTFPDGTVMTVPQVAAGSAITVDGRTSTSVAIGPGGVLQVLQPARPNPFRSRTVIAWRQDAPGPAALHIHDVTGRLVRTLWTGRRSAGALEETWDGRDRAGRPVPSGTYYFRLETPAGREARPVTFLR